MNPAFQNELTQLINEAHVHATFDAVTNVVIISHREHQLHVTIPQYYPTVPIEKVSVVPPHDGVRTAVQRVLDDITPGLAEWTLFPLFNALRTAVDAASSGRSPPITQVTGILLRGCL